MTFNKSHLEDRSTNSERTEWVEFAVQSDGGSALEMCSLLGVLSRPLNLYEETKNRERTPPKRAQENRTQPSQTAETWA